MKCLWCWLGTALLVLPVLPGLAEPTDGTAYNEEAEAADEGSSKVKAVDRDHGVYEMPKDLKDGLTVGGLKESGADFDKIMEMAKLTAAGEWKQIDSILIARGGKLVFEDYFHGGHIDEPHTLMSITKSVTACLAGCAYDRGLIKDLQDPVLNYYPNIKKDEVDPSVLDIKVHHILSSMSGLNEGKRPDKPQLEDGKKPMEVARKLYLQATATGVGENYVYGGVNSDQLGLLLNAATGKSLPKFAEETLFADLGIEKFKWKGKPGAGGHGVGAGLELRSRDMMKIGLMVLNKGKFNGKQVLSEKYVEAMTGVYRQSPHMGNYGYLWWSTGGEGTDKPRRISGRGAKGQFIFIRPDLDLVAVFTGNNRKSGRKAPFDIFDDFIVPSYQ
jgi:CubicO group peptidase (beta-lactamase class C family)